MQAGGGSVARFFGHYPVGGRQAVARGAAELPEVPGGGGRV